VARQTRWIPNRTVVFARSKRPVMVALVTACRAGASATARWAPQVDGAMPGAGRLASERMGGDGAVRAPCAALSFARARPRLLRSADLVGVAPSSYSLERLGGSDTTRSGCCSLSGSEISDNGLEIVFEGPRILVSDRAALIQDRIRRRCVYVCNSSGMIGGWGPRERHYFPP